MANIQIDFEHRVVHVMPEPTVTAEDLRTLEAAIDPVLETSGELNGIILEMESFPGWEDFAALTHQIRFIHQHHDRVRRVAVVTDKPLAKFLERAADHFVKAEVRQFARADIDDARRWVCREPHPIIT